MSSNSETFTRFPSEELNDSSGVEVISEDVSIVVLLTEDEEISEPKTSRTALKKRKKARNASDSKNQLPCNCLVRNERLFSRYLKAVNSGTRHDDDLKQALEREWCPCSKKGESSHTIILDSSDDDDYYDASEDDEKGVLEEFLKNQLQRQ